MAEIKKLPDTDNRLTPDKIAGVLFTLHARAHVLHLQTTSFAHHKALDKLYSGLEDSRDTILEYLLGIQAPKRFGNITIEQPGMYSEAAVTKLVNDCWQFTLDLCSYARTNNLEQLCNLASDLQGLVVKVKYLLTLK